MILLAENEPIIRDLIARALERDGHRVVEARNGEEALKLPGLEGITLLLADAKMPRMGGVELADHLRTARPDLKVLFISGHIGERDLPPGSAFLAKPFTQQTLLDKVRELLQGRATRSAD